MDSRGGASGTPLRFSKLAVVDFRLAGSLDSLGINTKAHSHLQMVDTVVRSPDGAPQELKDIVHTLKSQSCPRFVPSSTGAELMFVAEDPRPKLDERPTVAPSSWLPPTFTPSRLVALAPIPAHGKELTEKNQHGKVPETTSSRVDATLLDVGEGALPQAAIVGCPEFVPSLYAKTESLASTLSEGLFIEKNHGASQGTGERKFGDTFVILTDPSSTASVLGVDSQELAVSLAQEGRRGAINRVHLLYNIGGIGPSSESRSTSKHFNLGGCQPIRAAGPVGHNRLERAIEAMKSTVTASDTASEYVTWLACLTVDQRIAIVESPNQENWINMSMPYPIRMGNAAQDIWCPRGREEACFEVWSNPSPNS